jgi:lipoate-protein ligase A
MSTVSQDNIKLIWHPYQHADGETLMATDSVLLDEVCEPGTPRVLIARLYTWDRPTLSLGRNQRESDLPALQQRYPQAQAVVRRPTGGRALLHGDDVSFAFITNAPEVLRLSLRDSYCLFSTWIKTALAELGVPLVSCDDASDAGYVVDPSCLATQTPYDLKTPTGQKVVAASQRRRQGGLLQHGAIFIDWTNYQRAVFEALLQAQVSQGLVTI